MHPLLEVVDEVESTNDVVAAWIRAGCHDGRALMARRQTSGRGRHGRSWTTHPGTSLALSIAIVGPRASPATSLIPLSVGVGVAETLERLGVPVGLKWPNDIWAPNTDEKVGGILCEAVVDRDRIVGVVAGIGVNVLTERTVLTQTVATPAASIAQLVDSPPPPIETLAAQLRAGVVAAVDALTTAGVAAVLDRWRRFDITAGRRVTHEGRSGVARGVGGDGGLIIALDDGTSVVARAGEVTFAGTRNPKSPPCP
ncbi:MAG: biotin--[acetyl-CoA-carboxylase] ligase [Myxococcales bacterium]|nr:biotin--[acetyl-CoA-carboxylase] ligase [Myxococcales bacterium]MCB9530365.1 biotin--[acetyl-CoA-carboxylase] ligase [Myxococcales bacterium]